MTSSTMWMRCFYYEWQKRMKWVSIIISAALLFLLIRLAEIQLFLPNPFLNEM